MSVIDWLTIRKPVLPRKKLIFIAPEEILTNDELRIINKYGEDTSHPLVVPVVEKVKRIGVMKMDVTAGNLETKVYYIPAQRLFVFIDTENGKTSISYAYEWETEKLARRAQVKLDVGKVEYRRMSQYG